jgi:hypothetical protein
MKLPAQYNLLSPGKRRLAREKYVRLQKGKCAYCGENLDGPPSTKVEIADIDLSLFPPGFLNWPIHLHHNHVNGLTEGAVHCRCNAYLWQYEGK